MSDSALILGDQGPFLSTIDNFRPRTQQQQMSAEIETLINQESGVLVCESPTGTGKTLAYLVPLVLSSKTAIISTATRHLQDQVFYKDLPLVLDTLKIKKKICLLKGRSNYLCIHRLHTQGAVEAAKSSKFDDVYSSICQWSQQTKSGDINDLSSLEENSVLRPLVTSTSDNCLGGDCAHFDECFVRKARVKALEADIVVVNHHLYLANLVLNQDGLGQLLPKTDVMVFDEAHSLPETASMQLSRSLSSRQLSQMLADLKSVLSEDAKPVDELFELMQRLSNDLDSCLDLFSKPLKVPADDYFTDSSSSAPFQRLLGDLDVLCDQLKSRSDKKEYDLLHQRAFQSTELLGECLFSEHEKEKYFCWIDASKFQFRMNQTPIELTEFGHQLSASESTSSILVSATLSSAGDFKFFTNQLGLEECRTQCFSSPYDYKRQCRLYLPEQLPDPWHRDYPVKLLDCATKLIHLYQGKTFFLFTSHAAMETAYEQLKVSIGFPLLKQGQKPKHKLIDQFKELNNAVLLGTSSFWEGVDVKGASLSCVIIDKLPFASPEDPVLKARLKRMEQFGQNPFMHYQVPQMIIALKQGIGRLIRDETDSGVIMIGDCRLTTKAYGRRVLKALPPIPRLSKWDQVKAFVNSKSS